MNGWKETINLLECLLMKQRFHPNGIVTMKNVSHKNWWHSGKILNSMCSSGRANNIIALMLHSSKCERVYNDIVMSSVNINNFIRNIRRRTCTSYLDVDKAAESLDSVSLPDWNPEMLLPTISVSVSVDCHAHWFILLKY